MNRRFYLRLVLFIAVSFSSFVAQVAQAKSPEEFDIASDAEMDLARIAAAPAMPEI